MTMIYEYDEQRLSTGRSREIAPGAGAPPGWTRTAPPALDAGKVAQFAGGRWVVIGAEGATALQQERFDKAGRRALERINASYQDELDHILEEYPYAERLTWDRQEQEARTWWAWHDPDGNNRSGPEPATPYLDALATGRGIALLELVTRVIGKADAWIAASGAATGKRQGLEDQITAVALEDFASAQEAIAAVEAIVW